jgi:hypothetical protein
MELPEETVGELHSLGECPVCLERKQDNQVLVPCGHSFCSDCLQIIFKVPEEGLCPLCKSKPEKFTRDFSKNSLVDILEHHPKKRKLPILQAKAADLRQMRVILAAKEREQRPCLKSLLALADEYFDSHPEHSQQREIFKTTLKSADLFSVYEKQLDHQLQSCKVLQGLQQGSSLLAALFEQLFNETSQSSFDFYDFDPNQGCLLLKTWTPLRPMDLIKEDTSSLVACLAIGTNEEKASAISALLLYFETCNIRYYAPLFRFSNLNQLILDLLETRAIPNLVTCNHS